MAPARGLCKTLPAVLVYLLGLLQESVRNKLQETPLLRGLEGFPQYLATQAGVSPEDQATVPPSGIVQWPMEIWDTDGLLPEPTIDVVGGHDFWVEEGVYKENLAWSSSARHMLSSP